MSLMTSIGLWDVPVPQSSATSSQSRPLALWVKSVPAAWHVEAQRASAIARVERVFIVFVDVGSLLASSYLLAWGRFSCFYFEWGGFSIAMAMSTCTNELSPC